MACLSDCGSDEVLGISIGQAVSPEDMFGEVYGRLQERIACFAPLRMSLAAKILVCNVFLLPLFSFIMRVMF